MAHLNIPTGLAGSEQAITQGLQGVQGALGRFIPTGRQALQLQGQQAGAFGPEQQAQAFANFQASPGQQLLQQQGELALTRNAAALGGLGGGNVRQELVRFGQGLAQQDFGNQFNRLGSLVNPSLSAASQLADTRAGAAGQRAGFRTRAGEQIAGAIGGTTSALSNLIQQQGAGISGLIGQGGGNLSNLLTGAGTQQAQSLENLANILASLSVGQGATVSRLPAIPGIDQTTGSLGRIGDLLSGVGTLGGAANQAGGFGNLLRF